MATIERKPRGIELKSWMKGIYSKPNERRLIAEKHSGKKTELSVKRIRNQLSNQMKLTGVEGYVDFYEIQIGRKKIKSMAIKQLHSTNQLLQPIRTQFENLNALRKIPQLKVFIPRTVRLTRIKGKEALLLTDLTENGKYVVRPCWQVHQKEAVKKDLYKNIKHIQRIAFQNKFSISDDAFMVQINPATREVVGIWVAGAGNIVKSRN